MVQIARSLDFRGGERGLEAEHVGVWRSYICREHVDYFFCLIDKVRFVPLRPTVCHSCHSIFAAKSQDLNQNLKSILVLFFVSYMVIWSHKV